MSLVCDICQSSFLMLRGSFSSADSFLQALSFDWCQGSQSTMGHQCPCVFFIGIRKMRGADHSLPGTFTRVFLQQSKHEGWCNVFTSIKKRGKQRVSPRGRRWVNHAKGTSPILHSGRGKKNPDLTIFLSTTYSLSFSSPSYQVCTLIFNKLLSLFCKKKKHTHKKTNKQTKNLRFCLQS